MPKTMTVYLGWDPREDTAYKVARASIASRTKEPIKIIPLRLSHLGMLTRPIEYRDGKMWCPISEAPMSTEFAISRFCVPFLQDEGFALFCDCDILCLEDISNLFALADPKYAVQVVKHQMEFPIKQFVGLEAPDTKMDGQVQTFYKRKNWSSVILWNCDHTANKSFTEEALNAWPGRDLHAFKWLRDDEIGELPQKWNWLINVTPGEPTRSGIWHYTLGGPWFTNFADWKPNKYDEVWLEEEGKI